MHLRTCTNIKGSCLLQYKKNQPSYNFRPPFLQNYHHNKSDKEKNDHQPYEDSCNFSSTYTMAIERSCCGWLGWTVKTISVIEGVKVSVTSRIQCEARGLDHDGCPTTVHPGLHEGDQSWGTVCIGAHHPSPVDDLSRQSSTTAELVVFDVGSSDSTSWAKVRKLLNQSTANFI